MKQNKITFVVYYIDSDFFLSGFELVIHRNKKRPPKHEIQKPGVRVNKEHNEYAFMKEDEHHRIVISYKQEFHESNDKEESKEIK